MDAIVPDANSSKETNNSLAEVTAETAENFSHISILSLVTAYLEQYVLEHGFDSFY